MIALFVKLVISILMIGFGIARAIMGVESFFNTKKELEEKLIERRLEGEREEE